MEVENRPKNEQASASDNYKVFGYVSLTCDLNVLLESSVTTARGFWFYNSDFFFFFHFCSCVDERFLWGQMAVGLCGADIHIRLSLCLSLLSTAWSQFFFSSASAFLQPFFYDLQRASPIRMVLMWEPILDGLPWFKILTLQWFATKKTLLAHLLLGKKCVLASLHVLSSWSSDSHRGNIIILWHHIDWSDRTLTPSCFSSDATYHQKNL